MKIIIRVIVGIIFLVIAIPVVATLIDAPEILAQTLLVGAVAIYLPWFAFTTFMPKSMVSGIRKGGKSSWKKFWKYIL